MRKSQIAPKFCFRSITATQKRQMKNMSEAEKAFLEELFMNTPCSDPQKRAVEHIRRAIWAANEAICFHTPRNEEALALEKTQNDIDKLKPLLLAVK